MIPAAANSNRQRRFNTGDQSGTDSGDQYGNGSDEDNIATVELIFTSAGRGGFNQGNGTVFSTISDVAFGNGKFVAVGIAGQIRAHFI